MVFSFKLPVWVTAQSFGILSWILLLIFKMAFGSGERLCVLLVYWPPIKVTVGLGLCPQCICIGVACAAGPWAPALLRHSCSYSFHWALCWLLLVMTEDLVFASRHKVSVFGSPHSNSRLYLGLWFCWSFQTLNSLGTWECSPAFSIVNTIVQDLVRLSSAPWLLLCTYTTLHPLPKVRLFWEIYSLSRPWF